MGRCIYKAGVCKHKIGERVEPLFILRREMVKKDVPFCDACLAAQKRQNEKQIADALSALTGLQRLSLNNGKAARTEEEDEDSLFIKDDESPQQSAETASESIADQAKASVSLDQAIARHNQASQSSRDSAMVAAATSMHSSLSAIPADLRALRLPLTSSAQPGQPATLITIDALMTQLALTASSGPAPPPTFPPLPSAPGPIRHERGQLVSEYADTTASTPYPTREAASATLHNRREANGRTHRVAPSPYARPESARRRPQQPTERPAFFQSAAQDNGTITVGGRQVATGWYNYITMRMSETGETSWEAEDRRQKIMIQELMRREGHMG